MSHCEKMCRSTTIRADGLRVSNYYIWDSTTGQVWERGPFGSKGRELWTDPKTRERYKCNCPPNQHAMAVTEERKWWLAREVAAKRFGHSRLPRRKA